MSQIKQLQTLRGINAERSKLMMVYKEHYNTISKLYEYLHVRNTVILPQVIIDRIYYPNLTNEEFETLYHHYYVAFVTLNEYTYNPKRFKTPSIKPPKPLLDRLSIDRSIEFYKSECGKAVVCINELNTKLSSLQYVLNNCKLTH